MPAASQAIVIKGLYEAEIPVPDQSLGTRNQHLAAILRIVLIKLTGNRNIFNQSNLSDILPSVNQYLQQFEYRIKDKETGQFHLWARFNPSYINAILQESGIPLWGRERPSTLVWLAVEDNYNRRFISPASNPGYLEEINLRAENRGIALVHPLLDLEDTNQVKVSDIWGGFKVPILAASKRYKADTVLCGSITSLSPGVWESRWTIFIEAQPTNWIVQGLTPEKVLAEGIDDLADILAEHYGQAGSLLQSGEMQILIEGISDYNQYVKVLRYLESLNSVTNVEVKEAALDRVTFNLMTQVDEYAISQTIRLGNTLKQVDGNTYRLLQ